MTQTPLKDENGNTWALSVFVHDLTDRIEAEKKINESEKKYCHLFYQNPVPMWIFDPVTFRFLEVNQMAIEHYGYSAAEFSAMTIFDIRPEYEKERLRQALMERKIAGEKYHFIRRGQFTHIKKNGENIFVDIIAHEINYNGINAMLVLSRDITREVELQNQLVTEKINYQKQIAKTTIDAQEKERHEIGKELHDNVNQILTCTKLYPEPARSSDSIEKYHDTSIQLINTAIAEIRKLSKSLVPPALSEIGLMSCISDLLQTIAETRGTKTRFYCDEFDEEEIDKGLRLTIFSIIQEQTTNVLKYAEASELKVELRKKQGILYLFISDNGKGFDTSAYRKGVGITNMKNRAEIYHGKLTINSSPGKGCVLAAEFSIYPKNQLLD